MTETMVGTQVVCLQSQGTGAAWGWLALGQQPGSDNSTGHSQGGSCVLHKTQLNPSRDTTGRALLSSPLYCLIGWK